jgi:exopolysaccharide biosynthesis protein
VFPPANYQPEWKHLFPGLAVTSWRQSSPYFAVNALRVDLEHPEREILVTPGVGTLGSNSGKNFTSRTTSRFLEDFNCIAAINATPYHPYRFFQGLSQRAVGIVISDGIQYSPQSDYAVFLHTEDNMVRFIEPPFYLEDLSAIKQAAGGFFIILKDGENIGFKGKRNPLSIIGVSENGRYLFLVVIDGDDRKWSIGASLYEGAAWMEALGAFDAMILDGGGSSTLIIRGEDGKSLLINKPSGIKLFSKERPVAVHIGVK